MRRGQAAIEYLTIIGFALLLSAPLLIQAQESTSALQTTTDRVRTANAMDAIREAGMLVYSQGAPAKITFSITLPAGVQYTNVTQDFVRMRTEDQYGKNDLIRFFPFNVTGSIPTDRGKHAMVAEAVGETNVSITPR